MIERRIDSAVRALRALRSFWGMGFIALSLSSVRCSSTDSGSDSIFGDGDGDSAGGRDSHDIILAFSQAGATGNGVSFNPLCGDGEGPCVPDDEDSCEGLGGAGGAAQDPQGGAAGGINYDPGDLGVQGYACGVQREADCEGSNCGIETSCVPAGASEVGQPCVSGADCRAGLACVGEGLSGVCRPYCCEGTARSCSEGTFCDERSLPEAPEIFVPVCLPVDNCPLTDPFPCPAGQDCACKGDRACIVVRADGATACSAPGAGRTGDACTGTETDECAYGFVCSPTAGCMKLCSTVPSTSEEEPECPGGGTCLSPSEFPSNLGVCVGADSGPTATR